MIDPNYVKLFKMSQLTIEYLMVRLQTNSFNFYTLVKNFKYLAFTKLFN